MKNTRKTPYKSLYIQKLIEEKRKQRLAQRKLHLEFHKQMNALYKEDQELRRYYNRSKYARTLIIVINLLVWFISFRYFSGKTLAIAFAVIISILGLFQFLFLMGLEKRILTPLEQLKKGVDEIAKGNYDVKVECTVTNEIHMLINSFNEMAKKLLEIEKLKANYEENRKTLIANISHDLKTPITSIQGYIETMLEKPDLPQENVDKYHHIIYNNAGYMNKLIDDLFLFSKLDLEKLELQLEPISALAFMEDLMGEFQFELEERGVQFHYTNTVSSPASIEIDRKRIHQVFRNIIGNAVKYGYEENIKITVTLYVLQDFICIDIADNGPGIPADKLVHIFDRFYRVDYARTKDLMSTGLGLAIAKELVEAHNGKISVKSTENVGTCFTLMLPVKK